MKCLIAMTNGALAWNLDHRVGGCVSSESQTTSIYDFEKRICTKLTGPDVAAKAAERRQSRNKMASQLTLGSWAIFKGTGQSNESIWLGRTIPKLDWGNACIQKNNSRVTKNIDGVDVPRNGYAINVQWYKQKVVGVLEYVLDEYVAIVQSSSTLVYAGFDAHMHQVSGTSVRVPRRRTNRSNRMIDDGLLPATINLQTTEGN